MGFTHATELGVTIAGVLFVHLLFQLALAYRSWRFVELAFDETFEALVKGRQGGLWALGRVLDRIRQDNLSAATPPSPGDGGAPPTCPVARPRSAGAGTSRIDLAADTLHDA